jgi:hypothetical protein
MQAGSKVTFRSQFQPELSETGLTIVRRLPDFDGEAYKVRNATGYSFTAFASELIEEPGRPIWPEPDYDETNMPPVAGYYAGHGYVGAFGE